MNKGDYRLQCLECSHNHSCGFFQLQLQSGLEGLFLGCVAVITKIHSTLSSVAILGLGLNLCNFGSFGERTLELLSATVQEIPSLRSSIEEPR